jgi:hypothetical protein
MGGLVGGWVAGFIENKANSANQLEMELGLGNRWGLAVPTSDSAD